MNDENLIFLSASQFGSYLISGNRAWGTSVISSTGFVPTDFAGMNINIQEPVESSTNFLGYPPGTRLVRQFAGEEKQQPIKLMKALYMQTRILAKK